MQPEAQRHIPKSEKQPKKHLEISEDDDNSIDVSFDETEELSDADIIETREQLTDADILESAEALTDADIIESMDAKEMRTEKSLRVRENPETDREREKKERQPLLDALRSKGLDPQSSLEIIASYDASMLQEKGFSDELNAVAAKYGVRLENVSPADRDKLAVMYLGAKNSKLDSSKAHITQAMEKDMRSQLFGQAFTDMDALQRSIDVENGDPKEIKGQLQEVMATLHALSKQVPRLTRKNGELALEDASNDLNIDAEAAEVEWNNVYNRFNVLSAAKRSGLMKPQIDRAFSEIFEQYSEFIEDEVVTRRLANGKSQSIEHTTQQAYGRSKAETEELKEKNRAAVAEAIKRMAEEPTISLSMLEELHALNNKGLVPKEFSKLRSKYEQMVTFDRRLGLMGPDVAPAMKEVVERANDLFDASIVNNTSKIRYEIEAARLHNDMLDIHPFSDRNGSTSLLFLELMMAKKGHEPSVEREKDYYRNLADIVGYNPAAIAVVGHEQYKIANEVGYYGRDKMPENKKQLYDIAVRALGLNEKAEKKAKKKKKK